ncbi:hypothetical protein ACSBR2_028981 [Camellia fascicularis]
MTLYKMTTTKIYSSMLLVFLLGMDEDWIVTILDGCDFFTIVGIQNLIDRCLLTIDESKKLVMHQLVQEMGKEIVRRESPKEPGERTRLWNHKDSFNVLRENTIRINPTPHLYLYGTGKIEGLIVDMNFLEDKYGRTIVFGVNSKCNFEEFLSTSLLSSVGNSFKRHCFGIFSRQTVGTALRNLDKIALEVDAFARMHKLKLLQLNYLQVNGSLENFPKGLRWLCWHGCSFNSISEDFPLDNLVVLDMQYSNLHKVWKGTEFLESLKILDLCHSHCLSETPNFLQTPNLKRLILENCAWLVDIHESIGHLRRLVLLNLKDCKNLRKLPRSIVMLKFLETLDISDLSNLSSLQILNLSNNPIRSLPNCISGLIGLQILELGKCKRLQSLIVEQNVKVLMFSGCTLLEKVTFRSVPSTIELNNVHDEYIMWNKLAELYSSKCSQGSNPFTLEHNNIRENQFVVNKSWRPFLHGGNCNNIVEFTGELKLEPIGNIDMKILNFLGLSSFGSNGSTTVTLSKFSTRKKLPLQGCHEQHIFYAYLPGSKIPAWFSLKNTGSSISVTVPPNFRIQALSVCSMYALLCNNPRHHTYNFCAHTIISNTTKRLIWSHSPQVFGIPEADEDMMWLSYWKFENQLGGGDELNISVVGDKSFQVKEVGVHLVYKEQEEKSSQSTSEEASQLQFSLYGNVVPGNASAVHPASKKVYQLGMDDLNCPICNNL